MTNDYFKFKNYTYNLSTGRMYFEYELGYKDEIIKFREKLTLPKYNKKLTKNQKETLYKAVFNLFIIAGVSYYKTRAPRKIILAEKYCLSKKQANFWNEVYTQGLGQFWYENKLSFAGRINFPFEKNCKIKPTNIPVQKKSLVPLGGGKDSIVAMEILREKKIKFDIFSLRDLPIINDVAEVAGKKLTKVGRDLSSNLFELNKRKDIYNGHIPITTYISFLSVILAILGKYSDIVLSNEKSASFGNVEYRGIEVNHQWSKSLQFEKMMNSYIHDFITPNIRYYSLLRNLSELQIARKFTEFPQYYPVFSSCNQANFKITSGEKKRWCGKCPKCAFTFALFSAYMTKNELVGIFGKNLYEDETLKPLFDELLGKRKFKPFECVGTPEEVSEAMRLYKKRNNK